MLGGTGVPFMNHVLTSPSIQQIHVAASDAPAAPPRRWWGRLHGPWLGRGPLVWFAVLASVAFAGFLFMFSLAPPVTFIGLVMQNIVTLVMLIGAALAWWRSWAGAAWLAAASVASVLVFGTWQYWDRLLVISAPPMVLAVLLLIDTVRRR